MRGEIMSKKFLSLIIAVSLILVIGLSVPFFGLAESEDTIKIGVIIPLTGKISDIGEAEKNGIELAVNRINLNRGINNKKIELIYEDSQGKPDVAVAAYQKLKTIDNIKYIVAAQSSVILSIGPLAEQDKIVLLTISSLSPKVSELGDYIFRHNLYPKDDAEFLAETICKLGYKEIGYLMENTESAKTYFPVFDTKFKSLGCEIEIKEVYNTETLDFKTHLLKIKESEVEVIFTYSHAIETANMMKQAEELDLKLQWVSMFNLENKIVIETAGRLADGALFSSMYNVDGKSLKTRDFRDSFVLKYEEKPETFAALAYDDIFILADAMSRCNKLTSTCVKDEMYNVNIEGVTGKIWFDEKGDSHKELFLKTVKNGQFVEYN